MRLPLLPALCLSIFAGSALADRAVLSGVPSAPAAVLERAGFDLLRSDGTVADLRADLLDLLTGMARHDRVVIHLQGQFARSGEQSWYLGARASGSDLLHAGRDGVSLITVLEVASRLPGGAFVLLGETESAPSHGRGLRAGIGPLDIPQGVTVIRGPARQIARLASGVLYQPGTDLRDGVEGSGSVLVQGFLPQGHQIVPPAAPAPEPPVIGGGVPQADTPRPQELAFWRSVQATNTETAYRDYLQRYPRGAFRAEAQAGLDALLTDPLRLAERAEQSASLSDSLRRRAQRDLTVLGFDTRGVDGIFGAGSRAAIRAWQAKTGLAVTGYLDRPQIAALNAQAEAQRAEEVAARENDARLWAEIGGDAATEADLRRYLDAYPEGQTATRARELLAISEEARTIEAGRRDRADWVTARRQDTPESYRAYLEKRPDGAYAPWATARLRDLTGPDPAEQARAQAEEARLQMGIVTRILIERRLEQLGFQPGVPDGRFDRNTRQAIAQYQEARGLPVTGFVSDDTAQRMLAESGISFTRP